MNYQRMPPSGIPRVISSSCRPDQHTGQHSPSRLKPSTSLVSTTDTECSPYSSQPSSSPAVSSGSHGPVNYRPLRRSPENIRENGGGQSVSSSSPDVINSQGQTRYKSGVVFAQPYASPSPAKSTYFHIENAAVYVRLGFQLLKLNSNSNIEEGRIPSHLPVGVFTARPQDPPMGDRAELFITRVTSAFRCKYPCYCLALLYLERLHRKIPHFKFPRNTIQRLLIAAAVLATKFFDDSYYSNQFYATELRFSLETINALETCMAVLLNFDLRPTSPNDFRSRIDAFDHARFVLCCAARCQPLAGLGSTPLPTTPSELVWQSRQLNRQTQPAGVAAVVSRMRPAVAEYFACREEVRCSPEGNIIVARYDSEEEMLITTAMKQRCKTVESLTSAAATILKEELIAAKTRLRISSQ